MTSPLKLSYYGYFTPFSGYGIANLNWVKSLRRLGVDVRVHAKFRPVVGSPEWDILTEEERDIFTLPFERRRIGLIESNPFDFDTLDAPMRIANTMCESDHVDKSWAVKLNSMDHIIVPNIFNKEVFKRSGVTKPIHVIPHGVDTDRFPYFKRESRETFTFGIVGYMDMFDRKGAFDTMRAFSSEFTEDNVRLIVKSSNPIFRYYSQTIDPRITVVSNNISPQELNNLYASLDCFVFPSKAEGIGYPPREAMSTGLPVIVTDWSGLEDISYKQVCYPLKVKKLVKRYNFIEQDGNWAIIDKHELMGTMRHVYENQSEARAKGREAAKFIRKEFSWETCAKMLKEFLEDL